MKILLFEDIPRWYSLFWDYTNNQLRLCIYRSFIQDTDFKDLQNLFLGYEKNFHMDIFDSCEYILGKQTFGINDSITLIGEDDEWLTYQIKLPPIFVQSTLTCKKCEGTGKRFFMDEMLDETCGYCRGSKFESTYSFEEISRVCYSLKILFDALSFLNEKESSCTLGQLFILTTCAQNGLHGHSTYGYVGPVFAKFLKHISPPEEKWLVLEKIQEAMLSAHIQMKGGSEDDFFMCHVSRGQLFLSCPGNACELSTEGKNHGESGDKISCHNLDNAIQQLTLISGFAAMATLIDSENQK